MGTLPASVLIQTSIDITSAGNSPVSRYLDQLPIECSAEGGDDGNERQEFPCTVLAGQACLEPKHLERKTERKSGREREGKWRTGEGKKTDMEIKQCIDHTIYWIQRKKHITYHWAHTAFQEKKNQQRGRQPALSFTSQSPIWPHLSSEDLWQPKSLLQALALTIKKESSYHLWSLYKQLSASAYYSLGGTVRHILMLNHQENSCILHVH